MPSARTPLHLLQVSEAAAPDRLCAPRAAGRGTQSRRPSASNLNPRREGVGGTPAAVNGHLILARGSAARGRCVTLWRSFPLDRRVRLLLSVATSAAPTSAPSPSWSSRHSRSSRQRALAAGARRRRGESDERGQVLAPVTARVGGGHHYGTGQ